MLELIFGTRTKARILEELARSDKERTRKELVELTGCGVRSVYDQVEDLIALGVITEEKKGWNKLLLNPEFPLYPDIKGIALAAIDYKKGLIKNILSLMDKVLGDNYYVGFFTAASRRITPIDYNPEIHVINILEDRYTEGLRRLKVFDKLSEIDVNKEGGGIIKIFVLKCKAIPEDVVRDEIQGNKVWICSIERGIVECFTDRNIYFSRYGCCLSLLQNSMEGIIDEKILLDIAEEKGIKDRMIGIMGSFNHLLGRNLYNVKPKRRRIKEVREAVNTILGG